ncbi:MAG: hypothetical protein GOVbin1578_14 [Prokaryotic dsDNA virus sp.]|nr:MAG: hypothetical protein GOVbin1578_14 [Prokaryotic dsDNA virus sp.]|tara:strand:- start:4919 stop:5767 length:849 start_codon:yes stop_codon:yes gene_type:complete
MHNMHVIDGINKDLIGKDINYYLKLVADWQDPYPKPKIITHEGVRVVREDLITGTKVRGASALMSKVKEKNLVYVQPRVGLAGVSLLDAASKYGKRIILYMPSSKRISTHQACCIERGAFPVFKRIAAMPNLNKYAKIYAQQTKGFFIPLGLRHELVTAAVIKTALSIRPPEICYTAISTGVLCRALQIAWPETEFVSVAVARNLKSGELGRSSVISEPLAFHQVEKQLPPFPTVDTYDAKVWKYIPKNSKKDIMFWNVGKEPKLIHKQLWQYVDSYRDWNE